MRPPKTSVLTAIFVGALAACAADESPSPPETTSVAIETTATNFTDAGSTPPDDAEPGKGPPTVTGRVGLGDDYLAVLIHLLEPSDGYFLGMGLVSDGTVFRDDDGTRLTVDDLRDGDNVAVWIAAGCAESYPVQCPIAIVERTS